MEVTRQDIEGLITRLSSVELEGFGRLPEFWSYLPPASQDGDIVEHFLNFLATIPMALPVTIKMTLQEEIKQSTRSTLLRENSLGITLITRRWFHYEGVTFLETVVKPFISKFASVQKSLEIDANRAENGVNVKENGRFIIQELNTFVKDIFASLESEKLFPKLFRLLFQALDVVASLKFQDVGLSLIGGLLFLRLINPAVLFPYKYGLISQKDVTPEGQRALLIVSKILQRLANQETFDSELDPAMAFANRFIRTTLPQWNTIFYKFVTGDEKTNGDTVPLSITPEDLIGISNHDIYCTLTCPVAKSKQKDLLMKVFQLEKQTQEWNTEEQSGGVKAVFKKFNKTSIVMHKAELEIPATVPEVYKTLRDHWNNTSKVIPGMIDRKILNQYNDNLTVSYMQYKSPVFFKNRDFLLLCYGEILPEENFAIIASTSFERDDVPINPDFVRGDVLKGYLLRGTDHNTCIVTVVGHIDLKGKSSLAPSYPIKKTLVKNTVKNLIDLKQQFVTPTKNRSNSTKI